MHTLEQLRAGELCGARHLKLAENLTVFPPEILSLKETLEVLDLTGNQLSRLPDELAEFKKLRIIFCSENRFTELPEVLGRCPALTMVGFKANRIEVLSPKSLPTKLRWLILTDNVIERLPDELGQCAALQKLMLAGNRLTALPETLANCHRLELLRIAANRLEAFPEWLLGLPRLAWLAYAGNPFSDEQERQLGETAAAAEIPWQALTLGEQLGQGASGVIHSAALRSDEGTQGVAVKLFKGAVTSDGLPRCEMAVSLAAGRHPNLIGVVGRVSDHPSGMPTLVMTLIDPRFVNLAGPPSLDSCTRDVYPADLTFTPNALITMVQGWPPPPGICMRGGYCTGISTPTTCCTLCCTLFKNRAGCCSGISAPPPVMTTPTASGLPGSSAWRSGLLAACWRSCWRAATPMTRSLGRSTHWPRSVSWRLCCSAPRLLRLLPG